MIKFYKGTIHADTGVSVENVGVVIVAHNKEEAEKTARNTVMDEDFILKISIEEISLEDYLFITSGCSIPFTYII